MTMWLVEPRLLISAAIALTAVCLAAVLARLARGRASVRHLVWQGALVTSVASALAAASPLHPSIAIPLPRAAAARAAASFAPSGPAARRSAPVARDVARIVQLVWLAGFLGVCARYGRALSSAAALRRRATVDDGRWYRQIVVASNRVGYHGPLDIRVSREIDVPVVTGFRYPVILLPQAATEWSDLEAELVFLHEVAHVERGDHRAGVLGTLAVALHWYNPLIWWLNRKAAMELELAADEVVVRSGVRSTDYAEMLISLAERMVWQPALIPGVALVGRPLLSTRVHAILATPRARAVISRSQRRIAIAVTAVVAVSMGETRVQLVALREPVSRPMTLGQTSRPMTLGQSASRADGEGTRGGPTPSRSRGAADRAAPPSRSRAPRTEVVAEADDAWTSRAVAGLTALLDDPSPQVRAAAARSLARLGAGGR